MKTAVYHSAYQGDTNSRKRARARVKEEVLRHHRDLKDVTWGNVEYPTRLEVYGRTLETGVEIAVVFDRTNKMVVPNVGSKTTRFFDALAFFCGGLVFGVVLLASYVHFSG
jgi:hypothetical protein